jgi:hypothetical protein
MPIQTEAARAPLSAAAVLAAASLLVAGCSPQPPATPAVTRPSATSQATPTPSQGPDTETITVVASGVGTFDLATIPVAVIRNDATHHGAASVVVHFVTHRGSATLASLDAVAVNLAPSESIGVTADCTDACNGATGVTVSVTVGSWPTTSGVSLGGSGAQYGCSPCRSGHGFGNVTGTLTASSPLAGGVPVAAFAVCTNASAQILGGGAAQLLWSGGLTRAVNVAVVVDAPPASCTLDASTGW